MYSQPANSVQTVVTSTSPESGGRSYGFWLLVGVVLLVAVFNLLITLMLLSVLRVSVGMESLQVVDRAMVLSGVIDLDNIFKPDGSFLGYQEEPMSLNGDSLNGDGPSVDLLVSTAGVDDTKGQRVSLSRSGVSVSGVTGAGITAASGLSSFFSTAFPNFGLPDGVRSLRVRSARSSRIVSPVDKPLRLHSATQAHLRGAEGTHLVGGGVVLSADQELFLKSVNGSVVLHGEGGVRLDMRIPLTSRHAKKTNPQYRLCACSGGKLFRIRVPADEPPERRTTCANATLHGENNPCQ